MSLSDIPALAQQLTNSDPTDRSAQRKLVRQVRNLRDRVREEDASDLAFCLNAVANLTAVLALPGDRVPREQLQRVIDQIMEALQPALEELCEPGSSAPEPEKTATKTEEPSEADLVVEGTQGGLKLGQMLIEFGHATKDDVTAALKMQENLGLPIGECMLLSGTASPDHLLSALKLQEKLRGLAQRDAGLTSPATDDQASEADRADLRVTQEMFLGEALLGAGMILEEDLERAMHIHHNEGVRIGDALLQIDALSVEELETGIELHARLRKIATLSSADAAARKRAA